MLGKILFHSLMKENTLYVGNLDEKVTEALLWELMIQAGPVASVHVPRDRVTSLHQGFGFVEFGDEESAEYALKVMNLIKLYGKPIRVNKAVPADKRVAGMASTGQVDVGANLFIGSLDPDVDEKLLFDTFSQFGNIVNTPKVARDPDSGVSKGYAFLSYDDFDASDAAIAHMNGQYLCNKPITVSYAFKKDSKSERHGTPEERLLAAEAKRRHILPPPTIAAIHSGILPGSIGNILPSSPAAIPAMNPYPTNAFVQPPGFPSPPSPFPKIMYPPMSQ
jgi:splicing factor 3B subunit 4